MDWQKIWLVLDVFLKAQGVPHTDVIRQRALKELEDWNNSQYPVPPEPELDLEPKARRI